MGHSASDRAAAQLTRLEWALSAVLIAAAIALRFYRLGSESIWLDEAMTFLRSTRPLPSLIEDTIRRHHTPPYFLLMHYFLRLGDDEAMMRLPSAVFGSLALLASIALGTIVAGARAGVITGVLFGLAPQLLRYCQEARMYTLLVFFSTSALCGLIWSVKHPEAAASWPFPRDAMAAVNEPERSARRNARRAWLAYGFGTLAVLYTHNTGVLFWLSCQCAPAILWFVLPEQRRAFLRNWICVNAIVLVLFAPWLTTLAHQAKEVSEFFWAKFPGPDAVAGALADLYLFGNHRVLLEGLTLGFALFGFWALRSLWRERTLALVLTLLSALLPVLLLLISLHRPIWLPRLMLWGSVPFFVLVACGLAALRRPWHAWAGVAVFVLVGGHALASGYFGVTRKPEWARALRLVAERGHGHAAIFMIGPREYRPVTYYAIRRTDPIAGFARVGSRPKTLDAQLAGHPVVVMFAAKQSTYAAPMLALMKKRAKQVRKESCGHGLTLYEYRVFEQYAHPAVSPEPVEDADMEELPSDDN